MPASTLHERVESLLASADPGEKNIYGLQGGARGSKGFIT